MKITAIQAIHSLRRLVFTTREISALTHASPGSTVQNLARLSSRGIIKKITRGVWGLTGDKHFSPLLVIPFLAPQGRAYLSFIGALHGHGVISQIPQVITVASTAHSRTVKTAVGTFEMHQLSPEFFGGFDWHNGCDYLIASPEKALVDCLYIASRKGNRYASFPELDISLLDKKTVLKWINRITNSNIRKCALETMRGFW